MRNFTLEEQISLVKKNILNIKQIGNPCEEACLEVVRQRGIAIEYIEEQYRTERVCLEAIKNDVYALVYVTEEVWTEKISLYVFLNQSIVIDILKNGKKIKEDVDTVVRNKIKLNKMVFSRDNDKAKKLFNEEEYEIIEIDLMSLKYLKKYLLNENSENHFVLEDTCNMDLLKEISLSNNELIIVDTGNTTDIHKKIANKIIT